MKADTFFLFLKAAELGLVVICILIPMEIKKENYRIEAIIFRLCVSGLVREGLTEEARGEITVSLLGKKVEEWGCLPEIMIQIAVKGYLSLECLNAVSEINNTWSDSVFGRVTSEEIGAMFFF